MRNKPLSPARVKAFLARRKKVITDHLKSKDFLSEAAEVLLSRVQYRFKHQISPDGSKWAESKASIKRRGKAGRNTTLYSSGDLFRSLKVIISQRGGLYLHTDSPYAELHQKGGTVNFKGKDYPIEARPFMGVTKEDNRVVFNILRSRLNRRFK